MRKTKLLLVAFLAMLGLSVNAQTWTAASVGAGKYLLYNVGKAQYFTKGNGWGTQASMTTGDSNEGLSSALEVELIADGTYYLLRTGVNNSTYGVEHLNGGTVYTDQSRGKNSSWEFVNVGDESNPVYNIVSRNNHEGGAGAYLTANEGNTIVGPGNNGTTDYAKWKLLSAATAKLLAAMERYNAIKNDVLAINSSIDVSEADELANSATDEAGFDAAVSALRNALFSYLATAEITDPVDITEFVLVNPDFEVATTTGQMPPGWEITITGQNCGQQNRTDKNEATGLAITNFIEAWHGSALGAGVIAQTVSSLPEGTYVLECDASICHDPANGDGSDIKGAYLFIKSSLKTEKQAVGTARLGITHYSVSFSHGGTGEVQFGLMATDEINANWLSADNFKIYYAGGIDLSVYQEALAEAVQEANDVTGLPTAAKNALDGVVSENYKKEYSSSAEYTAAINAIHEATEVAVGIAKAYDAFNKMETFVSGITSQDVWTDKDNAESTFNSTILAAESAVDNATDAEAIATQTGVILAAGKTFIKSVDIKDGKCFDLTGFIVNPHFTEGNADNPTGWTVNYPSAAGIDGWHAKELRALTHNFEAFHQQFSLSQTIADMPKGTYTVTLQGFARHDDGGPTDKTNLFCGSGSQPFKNITDEYSTTSLIAGKENMGDNNGEAVADGIYRPNGMSSSYYWFQEVNPSTGLPFYTNEVQTLVPEDGDLTIGFKCETWTDWVIWDNFHLYYYGTAINVTLDETAGTAFTEDIENANVTLKKTIYEGWNTVVLPFNASKTDIGATELYSYRGDNGEGELQFTEADAIEANVPYLMKAAAASDAEKTFNGVTIKAATDLIAAGNTYNFVGTFTGTKASDKDYVLTETAFTKAKGGNNIKAFRAFIQRAAEVEEEEGAENARELKIVIDGEVTAIQAIDGKALNSNAAIFNLAGQQVKSAKKGLYIQNGKKLVVK